MVETLQEPLVLNPLERRRSLDPTLSTPRLTMVEVKKSGLKGRDEGFDLMGTGGRLGRDGSRLW